MTHNKIIITKHYTQLQFDERGQIECLNQLGLSCRAIAQQLNRSPSTISRELKRGTTTQIGMNHKIYAHYFAETGQSVYEKNRRNCHANSLLVSCSEFFTQLVSELKHRPRTHSIDSFVHFFKKNLNNYSCPSTPTVYRYIDAGRLSLNNADLPVKLRRRVKAPGKHHQRVNKRIIGQSIENRPAAVDDRKELGHWEGDLVKGRRLSSDPAIMTLTERVSRYEIIVKIPNYHAETCKLAFQDILDDYGPEYFKTVTFDNGSEFASLSETTGTAVYFAHPYSPWERGTNENQNGLIREFLPKGKSLTSLTLIETQAIQDALNNRPRRSLNYRCAKDILVGLD